MVFGPRPLADQYPKIIEKLFGVRKQRRDFFERLIAPGVAPKSGYRALARILNEGWINTVLTTNFDHCIEEAKVLENKPHFLVSIKTPDDLVRFNAASPDSSICTDPSNTIRIKTWTMNWISWTRRSSSDWFRCCAIIR
jgi:hypothetical protein